MRPEALAHPVQYPQTILLEAQKNLEKYRDLIVRIAGYCGYFVDPVASQEAEIMIRT